MSPGVSFAPVFSFWNSEEQESKVVMMSGIKLSSPWLVWSTIFLRPPFPLPLLWSVCFATWALLDVFFHFCCCFGCLGIFSLFSAWGWEITGRAWRHLANSPFPDEYPTIFLSMFFLSSQESAIALCLWFLKFVGDSKFKKWGRGQQNNLWTHIEEAVFSRTRWYWREY